MCLAKSPSSIALTPSSSRNSVFDPAELFDKGLERLKKLSKSNNHTIKLSDFLHTEPWVLVDNGSIAGFFDWVPRELRVGPWAPLAPFMLLAMICFALGGSIVAWQAYSIPALAYPDFGSAHWWCHVLGFLWMSAVSSYFFLGAGILPYASYTLTSWTLLTLRNGLAAMAPWLTPNSISWKLLELTRYPVLIMTSVTFVVWNLILMPFICIFYMDNANNRRVFLSFFARFSLIQVHGFIVIFAYLNAVIASPSRPLVFADFMASWTIGVAYLVFYLCFLDRIGVHFYPILSPRSRYVLLVWLVLVTVYVAGFFGWNSIMIAGKTE